MEWPDLPSTISSRAEGGHMEAWFRLNGRLTQADIRGRMPATVLMKSGNAKSIFGLSAIGNRCGNFRSENSIPAWSKHSGTEAISSFMVGRLSDAGLAANSTQELQPLTREEQQLSRMPNKHQFLPRAGTRLLSEETRRERDAKATHRIHKSRKANMPTPTRSSTHTPWAPGWSQYASVTSPRLQDMASSGSGSGRGDPPIPNSPVSKTVPKLLEEAEDIFDIQTEEFDTGFPDYQHSLVTSPVLHASTRANHPEDKRKRAYVNLTEVDEVERPSKRSKAENEGLLKMASQMAQAAVRQKNSLRKTPKSHAKAHIGSSPVNVRASNQLHPSSVPQVENAAEREQEPQPSLYQQPGLYQQQPGSYEKQPGPYEQPSNPYHQPVVESVEQVDQYPSFTQQPPPITPRPLFKAPQPQLRATQAPPPSSYRQPAPPRPAPFASHPPPLTQRPPAHAPKVPPRTPNVYTQPAVNSSSRTPKQASSNFYGNLAGTHYQQPPQPR